MRRMFGRIQISSITFLAAAAFWYSGAQAQIIVHFDLPAQPLAQSLKAIGTAANTDIGFSASQVAGLTAPLLKADFTVDDALRHVLAGTGLRSQHLNDHTIVITAAESSISNSPEMKLAPAKASAHAETESVHLSYAGADSDAADGRSQSEGAPSQASDDSKSSQKKREPVPLEELIVTGTHIRGIWESASPLSTFAREDIDHSGLATTEQFMQTLPQNFSGGISATNLGGIGNGGGDNAGQNIGLGTGVNLRGLGSASTLVLLDGRRLAPAGLGYSVDLSMIPLSAVERIDVLTDGASAVYGSDAVGGVVNIILRRNYDGAETSIRYGSVTSGSHSDKQASQLFGKDWGSGSALLDYIYEGQTALNAADRSFTQTIPQPTDLIGPETRQSVLLSLSQKASDRLTIFGDGIYSHRDTALIGNFGALATNAARAANYGATVGAIIDGGISWQTEVAASYNRTDSFLSSDFPSFDFSQTFNTSADVLSLDAKADGTLINLLGGVAKAAVGGQVRQESYDSQGTAEPTLGTKRRKVYAGFGELFVPIFDPENSRAGLQRLEVTLAARYEHYDDFGSTTNPKIGFVWSPVSQLSFRGTFGTSFRAPLLFELDEHSFSNVQATSLPDPSSSTGTTRTLILRGNNPNLSPEKSRSWTIGTDLVPVFIPNFKTSVTYFNIYFRDMIATPVSPNALSSVFLAEPTYATTITRNPNLQAVNQLFANPNFINSSNATPAQIRAIVDNRLTNIASRKINGLDFSSSITATTRTGTIKTGVSATYIFSIDDTITPTSPTLQVANTVYHPIKFHARGSVDWNRGQVDIAGFLNYQGGYRDTRAIAPDGGPPIQSEVGSWMTIDATVAYDAGRRLHQPWLDGVKVSLSVQNLLDRNPPFVAGTYGLNFDTANATAIGRFISLQARKRW